MYFLCNSLNWDSLASKASLLALSLACQTHHFLRFLIFAPKALVNEPFSRGGVGVEVLEVFWEELWLHFFWPTFWLHCILYFTYRGGFAIILPRKLLELLPLPLLY